MLYAIWDHLSNLKNLKNTHGGVLLIVKLQAEGSNFTESNTLPLVFSIFFKFCKWYQIAQSIPYVQSVNMFSILKVKNKGIFNFWK